MHLQIVFLKKCFITKNTIVILMASMNRMIMSFNTIFIGNCIINFKKEDKLCTICVQNFLSHIGFQILKNPVLVYPSIHYYLAMKTILSKKEGWDHPGSTSMFSGMIEKTSPPDKLVLHTFEKRK